MVKYSIDINCDLGESFGRYKLGQDEEVLKLITSANIACGFHAGDPGVMYKTVKLAVEQDVSIGAHPGFPDINGFGRREMKLSSDEIYQLIVYQIGALEGFAKLFGKQVEHVKPHGALYNLAARDKTVAEAIAQAIADLNQNLILFGLVGGELVKAGQRLGLCVAEEVFLDRSYQADGTLTPRSHPEALIHDSNLAVSRGIRMIKEGRVTALDGTEVMLTADTICIHGDGAKALEFVRRLRKELENNGIKIEKVGGKK